MILELNKTIVVDKAIFGIRLVYVYLQCPNR